MKILLIEDNTDLASGIEKYLSDEGYHCELSQTVEQALEKIQLYEYDCILLDISLPDGSGFVILEKLKQLGKQDGVIIISAKISLDDKLKGLSIGADDYLTKPFHLAELSMRIRALIRRRKFNGNNIIQQGGIHIDLAEKIVQYNGKTVEQLSPKEFELLILFISSPHRVLSKGSIAEHLAGDNADTFDNFDFVYAHVKNLKKKLKNAGCPGYIHTIYGMGYKFKVEGL
ncbi:DNA-binding response regulator, OmpR family, contains REC and winged-helix (wHTH) domain [Mariniphaga anaerophila]|uniref:DNA-binding response regulator, OmpR family, contains REC and winged-helix (WHTH) domain n=1 Tax=Mariniphaga anaerophila TaxID=1484053 RepID=A0A1M4WNU2_9BACT|nr:response regulator transcription factor [Mariniphaga anaerophila]SHE82847.1 DNA-binding response regulator, OmpR family, contains REC and winged-helix (wHTH) domain [Mariniphaga anaerophila]